MAVVADVIGERIKQTLPSKTETLADLDVAVDKYLEALGSFDRQLKDTTTELHLLNLAIDEFVQGKQK